MPKYKKSQLEDVSQVFLVMIVLLFAFMFLSCTNKIQGDKSKEEIEFQSLSKDSAQLLINFLRSPFYLENMENSDVSDAIKTYFLTEDGILLGLISKKADEFFSISPLEADFSTWSLEIKHPIKKDIAIGSERSKSGILSKKIISQNEIPTNNPEESIEIRLFFIQKKFVAE